MLKKLIRLNLDDLWLTVGVVGFFFLLIHLGTAVVLHFFFASEHSSLLLSGVVLPIVSAIVIAILSLGHTMLNFTTAVKFSQNRRRALGLTLGLVGFETTCSMGFAALLALLERAVAPRFWMWLTGADGLSIGRGGHSFLLTAGDNSLLVEDFSLDWWWFPLLAAAAVLLGIIMGALILRFGRRGSWVLLVLWMTICFAPQLLPWDASWFTFPWQYLAVGGGIIVLAGLTWSVRYLLRAPIKS
ncbi:hypothetical protein DWX58_14190 [Pseudoflavonifractor sp. AF19-9AC]|uniref:hypothetical protein n=1 Tax=Pseudoflavonifractor sp. AF19-9AC TaxID=2292244 RepID=UPI000E4BB4DC|nr:hypothetical protein [Pseudoflavonifractor sp. AF19-9AC]RHR05679.1 hypothetical protein DWX58_14190 [Pseudoflavonifractor sp. AF19-9AC]